MFEGLNHPPPRPQLMGPKKASNPSIQILSSGNLNLVQQESWKPGGDLPTKQKWPEPRNDCRSRAPRPARTGLWAAGSSVPRVRPPGLRDVCRSVCPAWQYRKPDCLTFKYFKSFESFYLLMKVRFLKNLIYRWPERCIRGKGNLATEKKQKTRYDRKEDYKI